MCPSDDLLAAFVSASLEAELAAEVERHLSDCSRCAGAVAVAAPESLEPALEKGAKLERYHILGLAGSGAVGLVYAAYDPKLDRKVALKVLRRADPELEERLLREARALARVRSPHVVAVHDAGVAAGRVHVAMEFVEGPTLRDWLGARRRTVAEILDAYLQAGRGLAAAHAAGIVHRDFKPDNVLIRADGTVTVTDFGLALAAGERLAGRSGEDSLDLQLTSSGAMVGTPAYMAPEQLRGERADARSDVFSFCVALHAALHRAHPFPIANLRELSEAVKSGAVRPARDPEVPARVRDAVLAGLRPRPEDRPSLDELLARLERRPARRAGIAAAALVLAGAGVVAVAARQGAPPPPLCAGAERALAGVWDAPRRAAVERAVAATGSPLAVDATRGIERALDDYAARWVAARADACAATRIRGEQSEAALDRRMACLDERLLRLGALAQSIERAAAPQVGDAVVAAYNLPGLDRCADPRAALEIQPAAPVEGPLLVLARAALARASALGQLGDRAGGLAALAPARALAGRSAELDAETRVVEGLLEAGADARAAAASFEAGAKSAQAAGRPDLAANAWIGLARQLGTERAAEAMLWADYAHAASERAGDDGLRAQAMVTQGIVHTWAHRQDEGLERFRAALALAEQRHGPDSRDVLEPLKGVAWVLRMSGKTDEALALVRRAEAINARTLGRDHPMTMALRSQEGCALVEAGRNDEARVILEEVVAAKSKQGDDDLALETMLGCLALVQFNTGHDGEAAATYRRSLAILEKANGQASPKLVYDLGMMARSLALSGDPAGADAAARRGVAITEALEPDHPLRAVALLHRGDVLFRAGRCREALPVAEQARAGFLAKPTGASEIDATWAMDTIGRCQRALGRLPEAEATFTAALATREKAYGPKHYSVADALIARATIRHERRDDRGAADDAERAIAMLVETPQGGDEIGEARLRLAQALGTTDPTRARESARAALADLAAFPADHPIRRETEAWLAARAGR